MKACIFDLDGTLTDTLESLHYSVNKTLEEMELSSISPEACKRFVGNGARALMKRAIQMAGDEKAKRLDEAMMIYERVFLEGCTYHVTPYKGITEMIDVLKQRGIKLCVLSNKPHKQTVKVVVDIFGEGTFAYIQGQTEDMDRKPSPEGLYYLLKNMNILKEESLYIGDSEVDIETGKAAEMRTIGVSWGFRSREILKAVGAEHIIDVPEELLSLI